ncbi:acyl-CoA dehydrogenase [Streptomyces avidinii]
MARIGWRDAASRLVSGEPFQKEAVIASWNSLDGRRGQRPRRDADPRRLRLHERVPGGPHVADSEILEIGEGTSEVQRMLIARELGFAG